MSESIQSGFTCRTLRILLLIISIEIFEYYVAGIISFVNLCLPWTIEELTKRSKTSVDQVSYQSLPVISNLTQKFIDSV